MSRIAIALVITVCAAGAQAPSGDRTIVSPDARLQVLYEGGFFTEGPAVAPDGTVFFSDITFTFASGTPPEAGHILRYDPATGATTVFRSPSGMSNGLKFDARGNLLACEGADHGGRRVTRTDLATGKAVILASHYGGHRLNAPNDLTVDARGRIYFSDPKYLGHEPMEQEIFAVYRIDPDGTLARVITDAGKPNGVAVSPDQKTLYVVSNDNGAHAFDRMRPGSPPPPKGRMALLAYDLAADGSAVFRKVLVDYAPNDGPDGLVCDAAGNLYVAVRDATGPGIYVYSPEGRERARIPTPELPTNVAFGRGAAAKTLYVTYGDASTGGMGVLAKIETNQPGYQLPAMP